MRRRRLACQRKPASCYWPRLELCLHEATRQLPPWFEDRGRVFALGCANLTIARKSGEDDFLNH